MSANDIPTSDALVAFESIECAASGIASANGLLAEPRGDDVDARRSVERLRGVALAELLALGREANGLAADEELVIRSHGVLSRLTDEPLPGPSGVDIRLAWFAQLTVIRAAKTMAAFRSAPVFALDAIKDTQTLLFHHEGVSARLELDSVGNPLAVYASCCERIRARWSQSLARAAADVKREVLALASDGGAAGSTTNDLELFETPTVSAFWRSSLAFVDSLALEQTCQAFVDSMDRIAVRNALRHGFSGLSWRNYLAHCDAGLQTELAAGERDGALAYRSYTANALLAMAAANGIDTSSSAPNLTWPVSTTTSSIYSGEFSATFARTLDAHATAPVRIALTGVTPRYLSLLVLGHTKTPSLECSSSSPGQNPLMVAARAGRRLAAALDQVMTAGAPVNSLPWVRVLSSEPAIELLLSPQSDASTTSALANLLLVANTLRWKRNKLEDALLMLPDAEQLLAAPAQGALTALLNLDQVQPTHFSSQGERFSIRLVGDIAQELGEIAVPSVNATESPTRWAINLAAVRSNDGTRKHFVGGLSLGLQLSSAKANVWLQANVMARTDMAFSNKLTERVDEDGLTRAIRGAGTPDEVSPLLLSITLPANARFREVIEKPARTDRHQSLGLHDIVGAGLANPYMATEPKLSPRLHGRLEAEVEPLCQALHDRLLDRIRAHPFRAAVFFPAVATFLWNGGKLSDNRSIRTIGVAPAFRLVRAAVGASNPWALALVCRHVTRPDVLSSTGISLLDIALESSQPRIALAALEGLRLNGELANDGDRLTALVQRSMGKLVERHPELIPQALACGAQVNAAVMATYASLHPERQSAELKAALTAALMDDHISKALASSPAADAQPPVPAAGGIARRRQRIF